MTITWERNVNEIVWESQTAPGITWTTVVGGTGGTEIPARRLLPNTVGTPGQTVVVNEAGTAVEYVDAFEFGAGPVSAEDVDYDRSTAYDAGETSFGEVKAVLDAILTSSEEVSGRELPSAESCAGFETPSVTPGDLTITVVPNLPNPITPDGDGHVFLPVDQVLMVQVQAVMTGDVDWEPTDAPGDWIYLTGLLGGAPGWGVWCLPSGSEVVDLVLSDENDAGFQAVGALTWQHQYVAHPEDEVIPGTGLLFSRFTTASDTSISTDMTEPGGMTGIGDFVPRRALVGGWGNLTGSPEQTGLSGGGIAGYGVFEVDGGASRWMARVESYYDGEDTPSEFGVSGLSGVGTAAALFWQLAGAPTPDPPEGVSLQTLDDRVSDIEAAPGGGGTVIARTVTETPGDFNTGVPSMETGDLGKTVEFDNTSGDDLQFRLLPATDCYGLRVSFVRTESGPTDPVYLFAHVDDPSGIARQSSIPLYPGMAAELESTQTDLGVEWMFVGSGSVQRQLDDLDAEELNGAITGPRGANTINDSAFHTWLLAKLAAGTGITLTVNGDGDIVITNTVSAYTDEQVRDVIGAALTAGTGVTITVNDAGDTITIAADLSSTIPKTLVDAKGDILVATANDTVARKAVGADGTALLADSTQADGTRWGFTFIHKRTGLQASSYGMPGVTVTNYNGNTGTVGRNQLWLLPFLVLRPLRITAMARRNITAITVSDATVRCGIYATDANQAPSGAALVSTDLLFPSGTASGTTVVNVVSLDLQPGLYYEAHNHTGGHDVSWTAWIVSDLIGTAHGVPSAGGKAGLGSFQSLAYGALPSSPALPASMVRDDYSTFFQWSLL